MLTLDQLIADGCVWNPHMWIGDGWMYCRGCEKYTFHRAWSHRGASDCFEVCLECQQYHGTNRLSTDPIQVAVEFTRAYAAALVTK